MKKPTVNAGPITEAQAFKQAQSFVDELMKTYVDENDGHPLLCFVENDAVREAILSAAPVVKIAFIRETADRYGRLRDEFGPPDYGTMKSRWRTATIKKLMPHPPGNVCKKLLRSKLPLREHDFIYIAERLAHLKVVDDVMFLDQFISTIEKRAVKEGLSAKLANVLRRLGRGIPDDQAADRKLAARVERMLAGPLNLN